MQQLTNDKLKEIYNKIAELDKKIISNKKSSKKV